MVSQPTKATEPHSILQPYANTDPAQSTAQDFSVILIFDNKTDLALDSRLNSCHNNNISLNPKQLPNIQISQLCYSV